MEDSEEIEEKKKDGTWEECRLCDVENPPKATPSHLMSEHDVEYTEYEEAVNMDSGEKDVVEGKPLDESTRAEKGVLNQSDDTTYDEFLQKKGIQNPILIIGLNQNGVNIVSGIPDKKVSLQDVEAVLEEARDKVKRTIEKMKQQVQL